MHWLVIPTSPSLAASANRSGRKSTLFGTGSIARTWLRCAVLSLTFALPGAQACWHHASTLHLADGPGILGGRGTGLPLTGGEPAADVRKERELDGAGEGAGEHLKDLALAWLGAAVDASPSDRELTWFDHLSTSAQALVRCGGGDAAVWAGLSFTGVPVRDSLADRGVAFIRSCSRIWRPACWMSSMLASSSTFAEVSLGLCLPNGWYSFGTLGTTFLGLRFNSGLRRGGGVSLAGCVLRTGLPGVQAPERPESCGTPCRAERACARSSRPR